MTDVRNIIYMALCLAMVTLQSCDRDHLYYEAVSRESVVLHIDWSLTAFSPESRDHNTNNLLNGVTVFAFDAATHQLAEELPPDPDWQSPRVALPQGTYDLVVINDSRAELPAIKFSTEQGYHGFVAYIESDTVRTDYPDYLAASTVSGVSFKPWKSDYYYDMPEAYYKDYVVQEITTVQRPVTKKINIRVNVKGMNYCKGMQSSYLSGLARSANLVTRATGRETSVYAFNLVNREFRNSEYTEAMLTQTFYSFGFNEENLRSGTKFELTLNFVLVDNSIHTVTADITPQFEEWLEEHSLDLDLDLDIDVALEVELPPTVADPTDVGGLAPETIPWNDIIHTIIL